MKPPFFPNKFKNVKLKLYEQKIHKPYSCYNTQITEATRDLAGEYKCTMIVVGSGAEFVSDDSDGKAVTFRDGN